MNTGFLANGEIPAVAVSATPATGLEVDFSGNGDVTNWYCYDVTGNSNQKVVMHTFKDNSGRVLRNYTMLYDRTKKAALWAAFAMNKDLYPWKVSRADSWNYDPAIDDSWQPKLTSSYSGSYTRGHQVASNDRRTTLYQMYQTDYFTNMTPQSSDFNSSGSSEWDNLETSIQNLGKTITGRDTLYVVTGAIFDEGNMTYAKDNNNVNCPVPAQYYKCVMKVHFDNNGDPESASGAAFLFEHSTGVKQNKTIKQMETITGFDFFANIPDGVGGSAESTFTTLF